MRPLLATALLSTLLPGVASPSPISAQEVGDFIAPLARSMTAAEASLEVQELQVAESHYRSAIAEGWMLLGDLAVDEGHLEEARAAFEQAASSVADARRAQTALALTQLRLGETDEALRLLRGIVARQPADGGARRLLAQVLVAAGKPEEAVQELEEARAASGGGDGETAFALASGFLRLGKAAAAAELFAEISRQLPGPQTQVLIGRTWRDFRHFDEARSALEKALELDPAVRRGHYYLGTVELLSRGRDGLAAAIDHFRRELAAAAANPSPGDAMTHLYLGLALTEDRHCEEAMPSLEIAAGWEPTRLDGLRFLGRCQLQLERTEEGVATLRRALELAEEAGARPRQLSGIHYQLGTALRLQGEADEAAVHFAAAAEVSAEIIGRERDRSPDLPTASAGTEPQGEAFELPAEAVESERIDPEVRRELRPRVETILARAYLNLGTLAARVERFPRAVELFAEAAKLDADLPGLQYSLGAALFSTGRYSAAIVSLEKAREEDPGNLGLRRMLALSLLNTESYERAAALLRDDPRRATDPSLEVALGLALVRSGQAEEGARIFDRLIAARADWPALHVFLGQAHAHQGDFAAAIASLKRALELDPKVAEANSSLGVIYLRQGRLDEAEEALRAELAHHPEDRKARYHLAVVLELARRPEEATRELRAVLRAEPERADARYLLGKIRLAEGAAEEAVAHLEAALALAPEDANIHYQLAQAYQRLGRVEEAGRQFEIYRELKRQGRSDRP